MSATDKEVGSGTTCPIFASLALEFQGVPQLVQVMGSLGKEGKGQQ